MFVLEKQHLIPVPHKINISATKIITRVIRKDNTIAYLGNRYALPLGSYAPDRRVVIREDEDILIVFTEDSEHEIIRYPICPEKGRLMKNSDCRREKNKGIDDYIQEVVHFLNDSPEAIRFLNLIRDEKPRYIRDQLKIIKDKSMDKSPDFIQEALNYCLKNSLHGATDFVDALNYFANIYGPKETKKDSPQIRHLIYTTNAVEAYHRMVRKFTKAKAIFPTDDSIRKVVFLSVKEIAKKWTIPARDWPLGGILGFLPGSKQV